MDRIYFVAECYMYASGGWEYKITGKYDNEMTAKQAYHSRLGAIIKPSNVHSMVILYDCYGNKIMSDYVNTYVPEEEE